MNKHLHGLDFSTMYIQRGNKTEPEKRRGERLRGTKGERERERTAVTGSKQRNMWLKIIFRFLLYIVL